MMKNTYFWEVKEIPAKGQILVMKKIMMLWTPNFEYLN